MQDIIAVVFLAVSKRIETANSRIQLVIFALPNPKNSIFAIRQMKKRGYKGRITASVGYTDQIPLLEKEGIDAVYSLYEEAGVGFAEPVCDQFSVCSIKKSRSS